jgi:hypothetical protein
MRLRRRRCFVRESGHDSLGQLGLAREDGPLAEVPERQLEITHR